MRAARFAAIRLAGGLAAIAAAMPPAAQALPPACAAGIFHAAASILAANVAVGMAIDVASIAGRAMRGHGNATATLDHNRCGHAAANLLADGAGNHLRDAVRHSHPDGVRNLYALANRNPLAHSVVFQHTFGVRNLLVAYLRNHLTNPARNFLDTILDLCPVNCVRHLLDTMLAHHAAGRVGAGDTGDRTRLEHAARTGFKECLAAASAARASRSAGTSTRRSFASTRSCHIGTANALSHGIRNLTADHLALHAADGVRHLLHDRLPNIAGHLARNPLADAVGNPLANLVRNLGANPLANVSRAGHAFADHSGSPHLAVAAWFRAIVAVIVAARGRVAARSRAAAIVAALKPATQSVDQPLTATTARIAAGVTARIAAVRLATTGLAAGCRTGAARCGAGASGGTTTSGTTSGRSTSGRSTSTTASQKATEETAAVGLVIPVTNISGHRLVSGAGYTDFLPAILVAGLHDVLVARLPDGLIDSATNRLAHAATNLLVAGALHGPAHCAMAVLVAGLANLFANLMTRNMAMLLIARPAHGIVARLMAAHRYFPANLVMARLPDRLVARPADRVSASAPAGARDAPRAMLGHHFVRCPMTVFVARPAFITEASLLDRPHDCLTNGFVAGVPAFLENGVINQPVRGLTLILARTKITLGITTALPTIGITASAAVGRCGCLDDPEQAGQHDQQRCTQTHPHI